MALLAYKARHSMLPSYLQNLVSDHHPIRQLRSSSDHLFSKPAVTSSFASRAFSVSVPTEWNSLKPDLHSVESLGSFKSQLKSTLFLATYDVVTCEIKLFWNNSSVYFTCNHVWNYFSDVEHVGKYSWAVISLWNYFEIISGKITSVGTSTKAEIILFHM